MSKLGISWLMIQLSHCERGREREKEGERKKKREGRKEDTEGGKGRKGKRK